MNMEHGGPPAPLSYHAATPPPPPPKAIAYTHTHSSPSTGPPVPPTPYQQQQASGQGQTYPQRTSSQTPQSAYPGGQQTQGQNYRDGNSTPTAGSAGQHIQPPREGWLPDVLHNKSKADLEHLLSSTELLTALLHNPETTHPSLPASVYLLQQHLSQNLQLAKHLDDLHKSLLSTRSNVQTHLLAVRGLETRWKKKQSELENKLEPWGPRELHQRLVTSIAEQESLCQVLEDSFIEDDSGGLSSEREVGDWVKRVKEGRRLCHLRRERRARWDEGRVGGWR